jgi:predicted N-acyltransferase
MHLSVVESIDQVPTSAWNRLLGTESPFLRHAFLAVLERTDCVGADAGWRPQYLLLHADKTDGGGLLGGAPMYLKTHSYGEYVFDWAWANAYERAGLRYYPKLVIAVPFTPATGSRLLVAPDVDHASVRRALANGALALARESGVSSLHWLFAQADEVELLTEIGHLRRTGYQFHWCNPGYRDFDEFLAALSSEKRKKIKQERRYVRDAGVTVQTLTGADIHRRHWDMFYQFYLRTIETYGAIAYLTREFFHALGESMNEAVVLILAYHNGRCIAGALNLRGADVLYGRYWGTQRSLNGLHFEVCYYAAIEYCIKQGLACFEAGAQGEHKLARGFLPVTTYSAHWLRHAQFSRAVADFLHQEQHGVDDYMDRLREHSPFRHGG